MTLSQQQGFLLSMQDILPRTTKATNRVLAPQERVSQYQALRAMIIQGAWAHGEEKTKGSLEVGKVADSVVLDKNPLKVDPHNIKDMKVLQTI